MKAEEKFLGEAKPRIERIFRVKDVAKFSDRNATVVQVASTEHTQIFVWGVKPGQEVEAHIHPRGQDTWIMMEGELTYYLGGGEAKKIVAGDLDVAPIRAVHGCVNESKGPAIFISIYSPRDIGYERAER